jgi:hypothetical protein
MDTVAVSPADWHPLAAGKLDLSDNFTDIAACVEETEQADLPPLAANKLDLDEDFFGLLAAGKLGLDEEFFLATTNNNKVHE